MSKIKNLPIEWLTVAQYAAAHPSVTRKWVYDCIKRGDFGEIVTRVMVGEMESELRYCNVMVDALDMHYMIRSDAPLPPKRRAGRTAHTAPARKAKAKKEQGK